MWLGKGKHFLTFSGRAGQLRTIDALRELTLK